MLLRIFGLLFIALGLALLKFFPDITKYQSTGFTNMGILFGAVFLVAGIALLVFG